MPVVFLNDLDAFTIIRCQRVVVFGAFEEVPTLRFKSRCQVKLTNSQIGLWPVRQLDEQQRMPGPVTRRLMQALADQGVQETEL